MRKNLLTISTGLLLHLATGLSAQWCDEAEDFEGGIGQWFADNGVWQVGQPTSGPNSAHGGNNVAATVLDGNYPPDQVSRFISPPCRVPPADQDPRLRFWHWFSFSCSDRGSVQVRETGSAEWIDASNAFTSNSGAWTESLIDLRPFAGKNVELAFLFVSVNTDDGICAGPDVDAGWYIDDVRLVTGQEVLPNPEGFDQGLGDWWVDGGVWEVGNPQTAEKPQPGAAMTGTGAAGTVLKANYPPDQVARLISPRFVVASPPAGTRLCFWQWFDFNCSDNGRVQLRRAQAAWEDLGQNSFTQDSGGWVRFCVDLAPYAGKPVEIAFRFQAVNTDDGICAGPDVAAGWYIDGIEFPADIGPASFPVVLPGDCTADGQVNLTDPICFLSFLFLGAPVPLPCGTGGEAEPGNVALLDWNVDGKLDLADAVGSLSSLFQGGCSHPLGTECVPIDTCPESCP